MTTTIDQKNIFIMGTILGRLIKLRDIITRPEIANQLDDVIKDFSKLVDEIIYNKLPEPPEEG